MVYKAISEKKEWIFIKNYKNWPLLQAPQIIHQMTDNASSMTTIKDIVLKKALETLSVSIIPLSKWRMRFLKV